MLAGDLGKADLPAIIGPNAVVIRFPAGYNRQYATCAESSRQQKIQDALRKVTGESWTAKLEVAPDLLPAASEIITTPAATAPKPTVTEPFIEAIKSSLEARVMRVDEGFGEALPTTDGDDEPAWIATEEE
jgi:hypothetical protein